MTHRIAWLELAIILLLPLGLQLLPESLSRLKFLLLLVAALYALWMLWRAQALKRFASLRVGAIKTAWPGLIIRVALAWGAILALVLVFYPYQLLMIPRSSVALTVMIVCLYPLVSASFQEIIFRSFVDWRFSQTSLSPFVIWIANAALFGWVHILYGSWISVVLSFLAGLSFYKTYLNTGRSLFVVWLEHSLFGIGVFMIGLGPLFYDGATP